MADTDDHEDPTSSGRVSVRGLNYLGQTLDDRYELLRLLGSGGMGVVILARHAVLGKLVAVKLLDCDQLSGTEAKTRLFREAQAAASIGHPNIIDVVDVGVSEKGDPYIVMEYLDGEDVGTFLAYQGAISVAAACAILEPVLNALAVAHELGIVHRDLKPQNIYLARRPGAPLTVKLIDFGIAKRLRGELSQLTRSGELLGTPSFMSPEQAKGSEVDPRSDLYAVGVIFHRLITGRNLYAATNYNALLHSIATTPPTLARGEIPSAVLAIIERCLVKDPQGRYQTANELLESLSSLEEWSARGQALEELGRLVRSETTAGMLGDTTHRPPASPRAAALAAALLDHRASGLAETKLDAPIGFSSTMAPSASATPAAQQRRRVGWPLAAALLGSGLLFGGLLWAVLAMSPSDRVVAEQRGPAGATDGLPALTGRLPSSAQLPTLDQAPAAVSAQAPALVASVTIELRGLPDGATVIYDGQEVAGNAFSVPAQTAGRSLRVEHAGFEAFSTTLVPSHDQVVHLRLERTAPRLTAPKPNVHMLEKNGVRARPDSTIGRTSRDSLYSETFE